MDFFIRNCPICNKEIKYSKIIDYEKAKKNGTNCKSCASKIRMNNPEARKKISEKVAGSNNPMYGKSFKDIWKEKYNEQELEFLEKQHSKKSSNGSAKAMKGKSLYNVWLQKYGEEIAKQKLDEWKKKVAQPGEKNGMFGKPSPKGSGNGWSGYYLGYYFRSILELSYLKYLLDNNIKFESAEHKKYAIEYEMNGIKKNYFADYYLINTNEFIEIKPKNLINSYVNKYKFEAAKNKLQNQFKIFTENDINKIEVEEVWKLYQNGDIIFDKGYDEKLKKLYFKGE